MCNATGKRALRCPHLGLRLIELYIYLSTFTRHPPFSFLFLSLDSEIGTTNTDGYHCIATARSGVCVQCNMFGCISGATT